MDVWREVKLPANKGQFQPITTYFWQACQEAKELIQAPVAVLIPALGIKRD